MQWGETYFLDTLLMSYVLHIFVRNGRNGEATHQALVPQKEIGRCNALEQKIQPNRILEQLPNLLTANV